MITETNERCFIILVKSGSVGLDVLIPSGYEGFFNGEEILQELDVSCLFFTYEEAQTIAKRCSPKIVRIIPVNVTLKMNRPEKLGCSTLSIWGLPRKAR